ncbi:MAG: MAPEG family protein [bacterium]
MTADLTYLTWTAVLCLLLWIPYIAGTVAKNGLMTAEEYKTPLERDHPDWLRRCNRAHVNLVENLPAFAALILVAHVSGEASATTATAAMIFFWARVVHAVGYIGGIPYVRTICFSIGAFASLAIAWEILN